MSLLIIAGLLLFVRVLRDHIHLALGTFGRLVRPVLRVHHAVPVKYFALAPRLTRGSLGACVWHLVLGVVHNFGLVLRVVSLGSTIMLRLIRLRRLVMLGVVHLGRSA